MTLAYEGFLKALQPYHRSVFGTAHAPQGFSLKFPLSLLLALVLLAGGAPAFASGAVLERAGLLGLSRDEIQPALADAEPVRVPRRLPSGAAGLLHQPDVLYQGGHFEQTFFFAQQKLHQIELVSLPGRATDAAFTQLLAALKAELGPELAAGDSASWVHDNADIVLYRYGRADSPTVRLVIRQRKLVDGSEL